MRPFVPAGPPRFAHQIEGLKKLIETKGNTALLFDPGTGKTAVALDYASLLALKMPGREARILVIAPLAAVDSWVLQAGTFLHGDVSFWAEAVGGTTAQKADAIEGRGPNGSRNRTNGMERAIALQTRRADGQEVNLEHGPGGLPGPRVVMATINFDAFSRRDTWRGRITISDRVLQAVERFRPDFVVVDESHRIKGHTSNTSKALAKMAKTAPRRALLTGTVMPHSPMDVFGQWRFLNPTAFGVNGRPATFSSFRARFAEMGGYLGKEILGFRNLDEMQDIMAANAVVAKKEDCLDLPPVTDAEVPVTLSDREAKAYADMVSVLAHQHANGELTAADNRLVQLMRLRQITSGHLPDDTGEVHEIGTSKIDAVKSLVNVTLAGENRIVVFAHFRHEVASLAATLAEKETKTSRGTEVMAITGNTSAADRAAMRARFGSDDPSRIVLVAQIRTMSLAVNELVTASHAVFVSLSQQRDDYEQARARLDRQGQTRPVTLWHVMGVLPDGKETVDHVILGAHQQRTNLEDKMLAHITGTSVGTLAGTS